MESIFAELLVACEISFLIKFFLLPFINFCYESFLINIWNSEVLRIYTAVCIVFQPFH